MKQIWKLGQFWLQSLAAERIYLLEKLFFLKNNQKLIIYSIIYIYLKQSKIIY